MKKVTSRDVAKRAGVSQISVSRAFNDAYKHQVKKETRERIYQVAEEMNYIPNRLANLVRTNKTNLIGLVMPEGNLTTYNQYLSHFIEIFAPEKQLIVMGVDPTVENDEVAMKLLSFNVESIIFLSTFISKKCADRINSNKTNMVFINRKLDDVDSNYILNDYYDAGYRVAKHFNEMGKENAILVTGVLNSFYEPLREEGFKAGCKDFGIEIIKEFDGDYTYNLNQDVLKEIEGLSKDIDAVFCANDNMAYAIIDSMKLDYNHSEVPFAIIGFDDNRSSKLRSYNLSTVRIPIETIVNTSYNQIICQIDSNCENINLKERLELVLR